MKSKINILRIVATPQGGIGGHVGELINSIDHQKFSTILCTSLEAADNKFKLKLPDIQKNTKRIINLNIKKAPSISDFLNIYKIYRICKNDAVEIVHGHGAKGGVYARILGVFLKVKVIYSPHGGSLHAVHGLFGNFIYLLIERFLFYFTTLVVFDSDYCNSNFKSKLLIKSERLKTIFLGVVVKDKSQGRISERNNIYIIAIGQLRKLKGHDILIRAIKILVKKGYKVKLGICGGGEKGLSFLNKLISDLELHNIVTLYGDVAEISPYLDSADIFVHPSLHEAFGYAPIEAMNSGLPVIVSNVGGLLDIVKDEFNGLVFDIRGDNELNLSLAIESYINNPDLVKKVVNNAEFTIKSKFNINRMIVEFENSYQEVLS
jgi:glycosyltransferase involved in cell wall biosynthesis